MIDFAIEFAFYFFSKFFSWHGVAGVRDVGSLICKQSLMLKYTKNQPSLKAGSLCMFDLQIVCHFLPKEGFLFGKAYKNTAFVVRGMCHENSCPRADVMLVA